MPNRQSVPLCATLLFTTNKNFPFKTYFIQFLIKMSILCCRKENLTYANPDADLTSTHTAWYSSACYLSHLCYCSTPNHGWFMSNHLSFKIVETWYD